MSCKDCIHYEICEIMSDQYGISKVSPSQCGYYKNTADVEEVRHGSWIVTDADDGMCENYAGFIEFKCSECGLSVGIENGQYDWYYGDPIPWKYCPICGAKMDGERREG